MTTLGFLDEDIFQPQTFTKKTKVVKQCIKYCIRIKIIRSTNVMKNTYSFSKNFSKYLKYTTKLSIIIQLYTQLILIASLIKS